jgi:hypothetical protein
MDKKPTTKRIKQNLPTFFIEVKPMEKVLLEKRIPVKDNIGSTEQVSLKIVLGKQTKITYNLEETILTLSTQDIKTIAKP